MDCKLKVGGNTGKSIVISSNLERGNLSTSTSLSTKSEMINEGGGEG